jgi:hypothetical protein
LPFSLYITISDVSNAASNCGQGVPAATHPTAFIAFETPSRTLSEGLPAIVGVKLHKSGTAPLAFNPVVNISRLPSSTASTADYTLSTSQIMFGANSANQATETVIVDALQDGLSEPEERLILALDPVTLPGDVVIGQPNTHVITIDDRWMTETLVLPGNGSVSTSKATRLGKQYRITAQGIINAGGGWLNDPGGYTNNNFQTWTPGAMKLDGVSLSNPASYQSSHSYEWVVAGTGENFVFLPIDSQLGDNTGQFSITVEELA